jgi:hypothetical protein
MDRLSKPQTAMMVAVALGFALTLAGLAALLLYDVPLRFALACDRAAGDCVFTQTLITGAHSGSLPVGALERAEARVVTSGGRRGTPRVLLYVIAGPKWYYVADYSYWDRAAAAADAALINGFLGDPSRPRFEFEKREILLYWVAWLAFAGAAIVVAFLFRIILRRPPAGGATSG